ncbi:hypothetical protein FE257_012579 [Aspergillus nanangensis]|uniref:Serine hydrolase domain-containing protein n=1 Tax=Aspergillus nanangensis TaxID=2582783 RepID=A0AAD4CV80_ASPNN|nr:hypothetical protein FE257_012579 [Aspergillus nanangensis]
MRILCLHGYGTSPSVMEYQLSALKKQADPSWGFFFMAGEVECPPAPGIGDKFPGPYLCYTSRFDPDSMDDVHELIDETIQDYGPFDGALGFSQGASVIMSYLLQRRAVESDQPLPVRFAVFCSSTVPLASHAGYCRDVLGSLSAEDERRIRSCQDDAITQLPHRSSLAISVLNASVDATVNVTRHPRAFFLNRPLAEVPCVLHPDLFDSRLSIPTLHVRSTNDFPGLEDCSAFMQAFCDSQKTRSCNHTAGHDIPRSMLEARQMLLGMEWVVSQSQVPTL